MAMIKPAEGKKVSIKNTVKTFVRRIFGAEGHRASTRTAADQETRYDKPLEKWRDFPVYLIAADGTVMEHVANEVQIAKDAAQLDMIGASLTRAEADRLIDRIDELYVGQDYRRAFFGHNQVPGRFQQKFAQLYDVQNKTLPAKFGNDWRTVTVPCVPCYYCGLALPPNVIEIDHWFEQKAGKVGAMVKVFRAMNAGLTPRAGQPGRRVAALGQAQLAAVPTRNTNAAHSLDHARTNFFRPNLQDASKQSLTPVGSLFFSLLLEACRYKPRQPYTIKTATDTVLDYFLSSLVNLVPACGACNKAKNNRGAAVPYQ